MRAFHPTTSLAVVVAISAATIGGRASPAQSPSSKTSQFSKDQAPIIATGSSDKDIILARRGWLDEGRMVGKDFIPSPLTKFKAYVFGKTARVEATWKHWRKVEAAKHKMKEDIRKRPFVNGHSSDLYDKSDVESLKRLYTATRQRADEVAVKNVNFYAKERLLAKEKQRQVKKIGHHT